MVIISWSTRRIVPSAECEVLSTDSTVNRSYMRRPTAATFTGEPESTSSKSKIYVTAAHELIRAVQVQLDFISVNFARFLVN